MIEGRPLGDGRWLVAAAHEALADGRDGRQLSASLLGMEPESDDHGERAVVRRELELASRVLDPPHETAPIEGAELSVVIPAHDVGPWIRQTLESLADQDLVLDIVVMVDHSNDETLAIVREAERAGAVRVVQTRLRGGAHARNLGAALAVAPRLVFCDGDDLVPRDAYRSLLESSKHTGAAMSVGSFLKFRPTHTWSPARRHEAYRSSATYEHIGRAPTLLYHRACWNKVFVTSWWRDHDIVFPETARSNDIVPMTQAYLAAQPISVVDDFVYLYRERPGLSSMSSQVGTDRSLLSYLEQEIECARLLAEHDDQDVWREYAHTVLQEDAWIQVGRYLRQCRAQGRAPRPEVLHLSRRLVQRFDAPTFARMPLSARLTFAAAAAGADALAEHAALTDDRELATVRAAGWAGVLEHGLLDDPSSPPAEHVWRFGVLPTLDDLLDDDTLDVTDTVDALHLLQARLDADPAWPRWRASVDTVVLQALAAGARLTDDMTVLRETHARLERVERLGPRRLRLSGSHSGAEVRTVHLLRGSAGAASIETVVSGGRWSADVAAGLLPPGRSRLAVTVRDPRGHRVVTHLRHQLEPLPEPVPSDQLRVSIDIGPANLVLEHRSHVVRRALGRARQLGLRRS